MSYGLLCALSWGISTLLAAVAARRIGALRTLVVGETAGLAGYLTLFALGHFSLHGVGSTAWLLVLAGVIAVAGYLAMYRGLESGHVGLVSAITACYGGVIAVLSVVLLGERLTAAAAVGVAATVVGVMLAVLRRTPAPAVPPSPPAPASAAPASAPVSPAPVPRAPAPAQAMIMGQSGPNCVQNRPMIMKVARSQRRPLARRSGWLRRSATASGAS